MFVKVMLVVYLYILVVHNLHNSTQSRSYITIAKEILLGSMIHSE